MSNFFGKQPSSRPIKYQVLAYAGNATSVPSTSFGPQTYQIRVQSEVQGWLAIGDAVAPSVTSQTASLKIAANADPEYFQVTPGQFAGWNSTSTSTGMVSITECA
jgi:hypothetical protein